MKNIMSNTYVATTALIVGVVALVSVYAQHALASFKKQAAAGEAMRVVEVNACSASEATEDTPHFSGCNSIL